MQASCLTPTELTDSQEPTLDSFQKMHWIWTTLVGLFLVISLSLTYNTTQAHPLTPRLTASCFCSYSCCCCRSWQIPEPFSPCREATAKDSW